jgi:hypothetical protein
MRLYELSKCEIIFVAYLYPVDKKLVEVILTSDYLFVDLLVYVGVCYIKWLDIQKHLYYVHYNGCDVVCS